MCFSKRLASGVPVAAYNVMGPKDVVAHGKVGYLSENLREAALLALPMDRLACRTYAEQFSWAACAQRFRDLVGQAHGFQRQSRAHP